MDERDYMPEAGNNTDYTAVETGNTAATAQGGSSNFTAVKEKVSGVKEKVSGQAAELKDKISTQASSLGNQLTQKIDTARGKTSAGLRTTSQRINNLAMYMEEHDARDMSETAVRSSKEIIRKHPGKSLLVGVLIGMLVGRAFSMGHRH